MRREIFQVCKTERGFWSWLAFRLPTRLVYWCAIRVLARASCCQYSHEEVPAITAMDALSRWHAIEVLNEWPGPVSKQHGGQVDA